LAQAANTSRLRLAKQKEAQMSKEKDYEDDNWLWFKKSSCEINMQWANKIIKMKKQEKKLTKKKNYKQASALRAERLKLKEVLITTRQWDEVQKLTKWKGEK